MLVCRFGVSNIEEIEDAVQGALLKALETWPSKPPEQPSAWLYKVAHNQLVSNYRQSANRQRLLLGLASDNQPVQQDTFHSYLSGDCQDETLRMFFACCAEDIPEASRLAITLKIISGFNVDEIALRLFTSQESIYKRVQRALKLLKQDKKFINLQSVADYQARLSSVTQVLYLMFTEGYLSVNVDYAIRLELCEEALRLAHLLVEQEYGQAPQVFALLALMNFHMARMSSRINGEGSLILLEEQNRDDWVKTSIHTGMQWLEKSSTGDTFSRYHGEAAIAAEHCLAPDYHSTRWDRIVELYEILNHHYPSPLYILNQAIAISEYQGPKAGLNLLRDTDFPVWFQNSYLCHAVVADLNLRNKAWQTAKQSIKLALENAPTKAIETLLTRRFAKLSPD